MHKPTDIEFLKKLQEKLNTQETDGQAGPRFWVIRDYKTIQTTEGYHDSYHVHSPYWDYDGDIEGFVDYVGDLNDYMADCCDLEIKLCKDTITTIEDIREYLDKDATLVPVKEIAVICEDTMFLTKASALAHIKANSHHYSDRAHTYAMTAWRSPEVKRLLDILSNFDFNKLQ